MKRKNIEYSPIYKGVVNMTPNRYNSIKKAEAYSRSCTRKLSRVLAGVELAIMLISVSYLILAMLR